MRQETGYLIRRRDSATDEYRYLEIMAATYPGEPEYWRGSRDASTFTVKRDAIRRARAYARRDPLRTYTVVHRIGHGVIWVGP